MFANRFTAFTDACVLVSARKRNLLLSLAAAEFFRIRWSNAVLAETERAVTQILTKRGDADAMRKAAHVCAAMEGAFEDAMVSGYDDYERLCAGRLPDLDDVHVLAAALGARADVIVTDNLTDFPVGVLASFGIEARSADAFIADTVSLDPGRGVAAVAKMRHRLTRPELTAERLLLSLEEEGLTQTVDVLRPHLGSL